MWTHSNSCPGEFTACEQAHKKALPKKLSKVKKLDPESYCYIKGTLNKCYNQWLLDTLTTPPPTPPTPPSLSLSLSLSRCLRRLKSEKKIQNLEAKKSALLWLKSHNFSDLTYFSKVKFSRNFRRCSKDWIKKKDGRFISMATKDLQTLNLKFDKVMFNRLVFTWERNCETTFGIFSVLVSQINILESYLDMYLF